MMRITHLVFSGKDYLVAIDAENLIAKEILKRLPISSEAQNIGGEIYFRIPGVDIEYDGTQADEFEIGDVVYWRSSIGEDKFAIAVFYGNTKYSDWKTPRASSPCVKIGKIIDGIEEMEFIKSGENVKLVFK
jgi:hypothetical protein